MKQFKELDPRPTSEVEAAIIESWGGVSNILNETIKNREHNANYVFYDGPATANGYPGLHHMLAKFLKDTFCKYQTMQGKRVLRKVGWDTHGLPVEVEVEKTLGFSGKGDIEKYGIEKFNQKCKESVWKNEKLFSDLTSKMGQFIDLDNPYVTYDNNYIETEWWILKKFFNEGLFYEGSKILPYCARCGTGLASHEVDQGYKEVSVDTVIVTMKKKDEDVYFLVWTTTPWTLLANVALCVNPNADYVKVESQGYKFILSATLAPQVLGEDYQVLESFKGSDLEHWEYEQLLPFLSVDKKAFYVTCDDYVTTEDGTGIVHLAPAFGADDSAVGRKYNLPTLNPVGDDGCYLEGPWQGMNVFDADLEVIKWLKANDRLFKKQKIEHNYPHCWRCGTPLIYYAKPSYYLAVTKIKEQIIATNKTINWYPAFVGEKRFGNWLENLNDWAISRDRYWGTPLPLWRCPCGHQEMIGSRKELVEKAIEQIDEEIDLHRPYVDNVHLKCPKCGKAMNRTPEVIDCWFDSGAMPFAQYHFPFENDELFNSQFPADFICEGIDQTRGWFYSLLVISTFVKGVSPYKNVLVNDLIQDAEGKKMSKSKGNIVEPFTTMKEYGADTVRFYLPYVSPVWIPLRFDINGLKEVHSKFFNPLRNTYNFFAIYANTDQIDLNECQVAYEDLEEIDKWLLSKYHKLLKYVTNSYDEYDLNKVVRAISEFVCEDLSNWYIRRNRKRFWGSEFDNSKKAVYQTTYQVLVGLVQMIAPVVPFTSEEIYRNLTGEKSVHLSDYPKYEAKYINEKIEHKMDLVRNLISIGRYVREENKIKVRQPLSEAIIDAKHEAELKDLYPLIEEELNVKTIKVAKELAVYMNFYVKPNYKTAGPIFGKNIKAFADYLAKYTNDDIEKVKNNEAVTFKVGSEEYLVTNDLIEIKIESKAGFNAGMENNNFIILNTKLTPELILEGNAREIVSKVQQLRKNRQLEITDRIIITYQGDEVIEETLKAYQEYVMSETLAVELDKTDKVNDQFETFDINDHEMILDIRCHN